MCNFVRNKTLNISFVLSLAKVNFEQNCIIALFSTLFFCNFFFDYEKGHFKLKSRGGGGWGVKNVFYFFFNWEIEMLIILNDIQLKILNNLWKHKLLFLIINDLRDKHNFKWPSMQKMAMPDSFIVYFLQKMHTQVHKIYLRKEYCHFVKT